MSRLKKEQPKSIKEQLKALEDDLEKKETAYRKAEEAYKDAEMKLDKFNNSIYEKYLEQVDISIDQMIDTIEKAEGEKEKKI